MSMMQVAELRDFNDVHITERPIPQLQTGEILVRIAASGICSGDLMPWYIRKKAPLVLGHEPAGTIVALGPGANPCNRDGEPFALGQRVALHHHAPCFQCRACLRGAYVQCVTWRTSRLDPGGIAEYVRVPAVNLNDTLLLPDTVAWRDAVLIEPLACVAKSLRRARLQSHSRAYVVGLGVMGLLHVALLRHRGHTVIASDYLAERCERAVSLGAVAAVHPNDVATAALRAGYEGGADVVICGPGSSEALEHACSQVAPDGTIVVFTPLPPSERFAMDLHRLYFHDVTLTASYSCGPDDMREALCLLEQKLITADLLGTELHPLAATAEAYRRMVRQEVTKAIITFDVD